MKTACLSIHWFFFKYGQDASYSYLYARSLFDSSLNKMYFQVLSLILTIRKCQFSLLPFWWKYQGTKLWATDRNNCHLADIQFVYGCLRQPQQRDNQSLDFFLPWFFFLVGRFYLQIHMLVHKFLKTDGLFTKYVTLYHQISLNAQLGVFWDVYILKTSVCWLFWYWQLCGWPKVSCY